MPKGKLLLKLGPVRWGEEKDLVAHCPPSPEKEFPSTVSALIKVFSHSPQFFPNVFSLLSFYFIFEI